MTFQQLHYILEIRKTGSISKTADNLFITRPSVSLSLRNLEAELGYPIFTRTQQGLVPTKQGEIVLEYASRICETQKLINNLAENKRNRVEIASIGYEPINRSAIRFLRENADQKNIGFSIMSRYEEAYQKLAYFELDAVITSCFDFEESFYEEKIVRKNFACKELRRIPSVILIGPGHHLYEKKNLKACDFYGEVILDTPTGAYSRSSFWRDRLKMDPQKAVITNNTFLKYKMLEEGVGYCIRRIPSEKIIKDYNLRCIALDGIYLRLLCVTNPLRPLSADVEQFFEILDEELKDYHDVVPEEVIKL